MHPIEKQAKRAAMDLMVTPTASELAKLVTLDGPIATTLRAFTTYVQIMGKG